MKSKTVRQTEKSFFSNMQTDKSEFSLQSRDRETEKWRKAARNTFACICLAFIDIRCLCAPHALQSVTLKPETCGRNPTKGWPRCLLSLRRPEQRRGVSFSLRRSSSAQQSKSYRPIHRRIRGMETQRVEQWKLKSKVDKRRRTARKEFSRASSRSPVSSEHRKRTHLKPAIQ